MTSLSSRSLAATWAVRFTFTIAILSLLIAGCGEADTPPKAAGDLTEAEKQQIRELQEQRASEWGTGKKK